MVNGSQVIRRVLGLVTLAGLLGCQPAAPAPVPAPAPGGTAASAPAAESVGHVRVGWVAASAGYLPLWVAQDLGMFEKRGLTAELVFTSGPGAVQSLLAREL